MSNSKKINNTALNRLRQDYLRLKRDPVPYIVAEPLPSNILEWHYIVRGPEASPYEGGFYHGKLKFPPEFPFRAPSIYMITPNGRFKTNTRLCLSISDFHPDTWNPAWSVGTILTGLLSFMLEKSPTLGSIETSDAEKRRLALRSLEFNMKDKLVTELFPEVYEEMKTTHETRLKTLESSGIQAKILCSTSGSISGGSQGSSSNYHNAIATAAVVIGFAIFAYSVKYVLKTMAYEE
ncbi:Ubiquitin-conjugating enzyme E2 J2 [Orchesella cincta]|uniref:Ubiquitin-conjugating enzyme E2 J2 n=1 Tax=Orchesella cincta TaxID=48709 RepID=A0A1D2NDR4_ORCCI|nr:Ubiquitin-conjugating enzyme E2 J2 [Orchesella cincta]